MRSKLTLMLVALFAMAGIATAKTPKEKPLRRSIKTSLPDGYESNDKVAFGVSHYGTSYAPGHYSGFDIRVKDVKMGSEVKMTAKDGYKFRKVEVKKTPKP